MNKIYECKIDFSFLTPNEGEHDEDSIQYQVLEKDFMGATKQFLKMVHADYDNIRVTKLEIEVI